MTLTLTDPAPRSIPVGTPTENPRGAHGPALLAVLRDMVASSIDLDPDVLHSTLPAGRAALTVAAAARTHAASGSAVVPPSLNDGPGILVMRDLVGVLSLLERTVDPHAAPLDPAAGLPRELADAYRRFLMIVEPRA